MTTASIDNKTARNLNAIDKARIEKIGIAIEGLKALASLNVLDDTFRIYAGAVSDHLVAARAHIKHGEIALYYQTVEKAVKLLGSIEAHRPQEAF